MGMIRAQQFIDLETQVLVRSINSINVELDQHSDGSFCSKGCMSTAIMLFTVTS